LPTSQYTYETRLHQDKEVIYVGIAGKSLRKRDYKQHFIGNAESSTLRKSLGSLFGFHKISRSKTREDGKTKFSDTDEQIQSKWMKENLVLYVIENDSPELLENLLIRKFNPPFNLSKKKPNQPRI